MTRDEILNMPAGREMDVLISDKVFGMRLEKNYGLAGGYYWVGNGVHFGERPANDVEEYSTDIAAAWKVVEKISEMLLSEKLSAPNGYNYLTLSQLGYKTGYAASFDCLFNDNWYEDITEYKFAARAETAPLAICRAALLAVMELP